MLSTFVVNTTSDLDRGGGLPSGQESLRQAIEDANADTTPDVITFNVGSGGHQVITLPSALPLITNTVTIDGRTQPQYAGSPIIEISGGGLHNDEFDIDAAGSVFLDLVINSGGVPLSSSARAAGLTVQGCYIGTDWTGEAASPVDYGLWLDGPGATIGGTGLGQGNLISGAVNDGILLSYNQGVVIQGNKIGTDAAGKMPIPNGNGIGGRGNAGAATDLIGGTGSGAGNLISGNTNAGIALDGVPDVAVFPAATIQGNMIGTDITGMHALPNGNGVIVSTSLIGGTDPHAGNLVSGNRNVGVGGGYNSLIQGNLIGTDVTGSSALGNRLGIASGGGCTIGGTISAARNIISANGSGIFDSNDLIVGNFIGTDVTGEAALGNIDGGIELVSGDTIGGTAAGARNVISGNGSGIRYATNCLIQGNLIGTNKEGTQGIGNNNGFYYDGASRSIADTIGGTANGAGNLISGNGWGIYVFGQTGNPTSTNLVIQGNLIGTDVTGSGRLGNGNGVVLSNGVSNNLVGGTTPGSGNVIAFNDGPLGVFLSNQPNFNSSSTPTVEFGNSLLGNSIHDNGNGNAFVDRTEIWLDPDSNNPQQGPNGLQAAPVLTLAVAGTSTRATGSLTSARNNSYRVEFFASPGTDRFGNPEGERYLGYVNATTDGSGFAPINAPGLGASNVGEAITATATVLTGLLAGSTSEFSLGTPAINIVTTTTLAASSSTSSLGQPSALTATVSAGPGSGTPTGSVDFVDTTTGNDLGTFALANGMASLSTSALPVGPNTIRASYPGDGTYLPSSSTITVTVLNSILVLNPTAKGALTVSGNASLRVPGAVVVDSGSTSAISASGSAQLGASAIDVAGGFQSTGNAALSPAPTTGVSWPDPLFGLASPGVAGLTNYGPVTLSGNSQRTIGPGIYSQIAVSGNASLTLGPGVYIIEGGGLTVSGNASIVGSGVMIYNAGSNYPNSGGNFGGIAFSGNGTVSLSAATTGTYAGLLIFQSRQNTRALSFSGGAMAGMAGTIYAPNALLAMSGNAQLQSSLIVGTLNVSGNVALTQTAAGTDGSGDAVGLADTLVAGNLEVYVNDPSGLFTADEQARIQDAIGTWDALLVPYNVTITEVTDPTQANVVIDTSTTSACGGMTNGVLGCYNGANGEITLIQGWSWYAGAAPGQVGAGQYDFETTVLHELGHALGLGHSADPGSPMYATLAAGTASRVVSTQDLNIPDPPSGADPQMARPRWPVSRPVVTATTTPETSIAVLDFALADLGSALAAWISSRGPQRDRPYHLGGASRSPQVDPAVIDRLLGE